MANEFIARKGLIVSGSTVVTGAVTASFLRGDGSNITNIIATSASFATTASYSSNFNNVAVDSYTFIGNGTTTQYQVSKSYSDASVIVAVGGLTYVSPDDYTISGPTVTFVEAPASQSNIVVKAFVNNTTNSTGSFTGSFIGNLNGTGSWATSASVAITVPYSGLTGVPAGIVSSSGQIDHNLTVNYSANRHIDHTTVSITAGSGLTGGGDISTTRTLTLDTSSLHFESGVRKEITGSSTTGASGINLSYNQTTGNISASLVNSSVTVNGQSISLGGSGTITANTTNTLTLGNGLTGTSFNGGAAVTTTVDTGSTHFTNGVKAKLNTDGVISSSGQVSYLGLSNIPSGIVSGSTASSPSQGTVRVTINGVNTDVDTGLQTGDSPTFDRVITNGLYGPGTSGNIPIWQYNSTNLGYGIVYVEGSPDTLRIDVSGQALTGTPDVLIGGDYIQVNGNTVWHAGNDGAGSGLDADLLDGLQASVFASTGSNTLTGIQTISNTTNSTATNNGALIVAGGVGIAKDVNISGSLRVSGVLTVATMSTQYVTSSQYNIGTSKILLNDDDNVRFAGISIFDSGSTNATASIYWDSLNHNFIYENLGGSSYTSAMFIAGPVNTGALGNEQGLTVNRVPVATAGDHIDSRLASSSIRIDFPSRFTHIEAGLHVTGSVTSSTFNSTQATGTAPFVVASTTVVSNLNADLLDGNHASAFYLASNPSGYTTNTGTVTSVSGTGTVSGLTLSGTVTTTGNITLGGTLSVAASNFSSQTANTFLAAPNGSAGTPTFRAIVAADIPTLNQNTTGTASNITAYTINQNLGTSNTPTFNYVIFKDSINANTYGFRGLSGVITCDGGAQYPTAWNFQYGGTSTSAMYISSSGNVGIGTTNPVVHSATNSALVVRGAGTSRGIIELWDGGGTGKALFQQVGSTTYVGNLGGLGDLILLTNGTGTSATETMILKASGNVGIGTTSPNRTLSVNGSTNITGSLDVTSAFTAQTKSFKIQHQTQPDKSLVYGVLEGPEHAVYVRGRLTDNNTINLPVEWEWLIDESSITVQLTPIGAHQKLYVDFVTNKQIVVKVDVLFDRRIDCYYLVHATRKDVEPLQTVQ